MRERGYTFTELVATVAIAGILAAMAWPSFDEAMAGVRVRTAAHALSADLAQARILAVTRGMPVGVCPTDASGGCRRDGVWDEGWQLFEDAGRLRRPRIDDDVIRVHAPEGIGRVRIRTPPGRSQARFLPDGRASGSNLSVRICSDRAGTPGISLVVNNAGRIRSETLPADDPACPRDP